MVFSNWTKKERQENGCGVVVVLNDGVEYSGLDVVRGYFKF